MAIEHIGFGDSGLRRASAMVAAVDIMEDYVKVLEKPVKRAERLRLRPRSGMSDSQRLCCLLDVVIFVGS